MKVDRHAGQLTEVMKTAPRSEELGFDGLWFAEIAGDPMVPMTLAAAATESVDLGTAIVVALARTPMTLAMTGNDLQVLSKGRVILGLGSQIKPHIERRYSMPWSRPAARMREFVVAMHAIWSCWNDGTKLDFRGDFYTHTLMTPVFSPPPNPWGAPRVYLSAVGPKMTEIAGEVADGMLAHPFSTERYLREVTMPALEVGLKRANRTRDGFEVAAPSMVVTGRSEEEYAKHASEVRRRIAFYASTPNYRTVLESHGWGALQDELNSMSKQGRWEDMGLLIDDEILQTFAVCGEPHEIAPEIARRYGDLCDRVLFESVPPEQDAGAFADAVQVLHATQR